MFSKLRLENKKKNNEKENQYSYTQRSISRRKMKSSYTQIHKTSKKINPNEPQLYWSHDFLFQGCIKDDKKTSEGIAILKNGTTIIGRWVKNFLHGRALIFTPFGGILVGNYINGKLNGWSISLFLDKIIILTYYFEDKIDGERIIFEESENIWVASKYSQNGKFIHISHVENGKRNKLPSFLNSQFDELDDLFEEVVENRIFSLVLHKIKQKKVTETVQYIGYTNEDGDPEGLGVLYSSNEFYAGNFKDGSLEEFGRMVFSNGQIYQGGFTGGDFWQEGIFFNPLQNRSKIINSKEGQQQVLQTIEGYALVDFNIKIGTKMKNPNLGLSLHGLNEQSKNLEKYFYSYYIEFGVKKHDKGSNEENHSGRKDEEPFFQEEDSSKILKRKKWLPLDFEGESEEEIKYRKLSHEEFFEQPSIQKQINHKNFQSLQIHENFNSLESETHNKSSPRSIRKKEMFSNSNEMKSVNSQQLTFRFQNLDTPDTAKNIEVKPIKEERSSIYDSDMSRMTSKVGQLMKKGTHRRQKIFS